MTILHLYATVTGCSNLLSVTISDSHIANSATAVIQCKNTTLQIGDEVEIDLGYTTDHDVLFRGYVKGVEKKIPDGTYTITCNDILIRAIDYFIASSSPESPFTRSNITAEALVGDVLELAGITAYDYTSTMFTFGVNSPVEVNLVSALDFCKLIADIIAWHIYADRDGTVWFVNRKPYVMTGDSGQPGDVEDVPLKTVTGKLTLQKTSSERDLRNKIVVYGRNPISAETSAEESYNPDTDTYEQILPDGFYKTAVVASEWIDTEQIAQDAADYNLDLFNRLTSQATASIVGDSDLSARVVVTFEDTITGMSGNWYIFSCEHQWSSQGYITNLGLRK